jgi:hypothetical protein
MTQDFLTEVDIYYAIEQLRISHYVTGFFSALDSLQYFTFSSTEMVLIFKC